MAAGALAYLVKPFPHTMLAARLAGYARYRRILGAPNIDNAVVEEALRALRPAPAPSTTTVTVSSTKDLVLHTILEATGPLSAGEVATAIGISRATAGRYLAALVGQGIIDMRLRYGATGRPEQEYSAAPATDRIAIRGGASGYVAGCARAIAASPSGRSTSDSARRCSRKPGR